MTPTPHPSLVEGGARDGYERVSPSVLSVFVKRETTRTSSSPDSALSPVGLMSCSRDTCEPPNRSQFSSPPGAHW